MPTPEGKLQGLGVDILQALDVDVRSGDVALLPCDDWSCHRQSCIAHREDRMASRAEATFMELALADGPPQEHRRGNLVTAGRRTAHQS